MCPATGRVPRRRRCRSRRGGPQPRERATAAGVPVLLPSTVRTHRRHQSSVEDVPGHSSLAHVGPNREPVPHLRRRERLPGGAHRSRRRVAVRCARNDGPRRRPRGRVRRPRDFVSIDVAPRVGLTRQSVSKVASELAEFGLVRLVDDGRFRRLYATDLLARKREANRDRAVAFEEALLRRLTGEGLAPELVRREETRLLLRFGTGAKRVLLEIPLDPYATAWKATA